MSDDNKRNIYYFESSSMRKLYECMNAWQDVNHMRLLSVSIKEDGGRFCCIALTNPTEVIISNSRGNSVRVSDDGELIVWENGQFHMP